MKYEKKCPKCGGEEIAEAEATEYTSAGRTVQTVATYENPNALMFRGRRESTLHAYVCVQCGYTEFYAQGPGNLRQGRK